MVRFRIAESASAMGVSKGFNVLDEKEVEEANETKGLGVTSCVEEFWALKYEAFPPRS